ncbi:MAG: hypothetical protein U9Q67_00200, partial [Patescibacteria group bacterium]|nr:hypothetical protein [Patescibacteria group bacterium]
MIKIKKLLKLITGNLSLRIREVKVNNMIRSLVLLCIVSYGFWVRVYRVVPYKLYKDSYKFLFTAKAVAKSVSVSEIFPGYADFAEASLLERYKWGYGVLVGAIAWFLDLCGADLTRGWFEGVAHGVTVLSGVLTIFLIYYFIKISLKNKWIGLFAAFMFAISGAQAVWSGFIITEPLAALFIIMFLISKMVWKRWTWSIIFAWLMYYTRPELFIVPLMFVSVDIVELFIKWLGYWWAGRDVGGGM